MTSKEACTFCGARSHPSSACYQNPKNKSKRMKFVAYRVVDPPSTTRKVVVVALDPNDAELAIEQRNLTEKLLEDAFPNVERVGVFEELSTFPNVRKLEKAVGFWKSEREKRASLVRKET